MKTSFHIGRKAQLGAAIVEFAIVAAVFFTLLIGIMELGRILFYWNTAAEVTRLGARMAVVCDMGDTDIREKMVKLFPTLITAEITIDYQPSSPLACSAAEDNCEWVTVSIAKGAPIKTFIPFVPLSFSMPAFSTTLPRESMQSTFDGTANPVCQ